MRKNSVKNTRINEAVRNELSRIISREVKDPRISMMTTVTSAIVAPDLKTCRVMISVLGGAEEKQETMAGLKSSARFIRHELAVSLNLRNTPELHFFLDESIEYGVMMSKRIDDVLQAERSKKGDAYDAEESEEVDFDEDDLEEEEFEDED